jgi:hypothetical protein
VPRKDMGKMIIKLLKLGVKNEGQW